MGRVPGFGLQLRLLLWKNWLTKKRHPVVSILEVVIPLVLFVVILCIRRSQTVYPQPTRHYRAQPLLSAGVVPVLQTFCVHDGSRAESVFTRDNPRLEEVLRTVTMVAEGLEPLLERLGSDDGVSVNATLDTLLDMASRVPKNFTSIPLSSLLNNSTETSGRLNGDFRLIEVTAQKLLESNVNVAAVVDLVLQLISENAETILASRGDPASLTRAEDLNLSWITSQEVLSMLAALEVAGRKLVPPWLAGELGCVSFQKHINEISKPETREKHWRKFWTLIEPLLCGSDVKKARDLHESAKEEAPFNHDQKALLEVIYRLQHRAPRILYAPNNTLVNTLIHKVNETFRLVENITRSVRRLSQEVPQVTDRLWKMTDNSTSAVVDVLVKHGQRAVSGLGDLTCLWLTGVGSVNLDLFRGFSSEADLENYFLTRQFRDNVTVIAGLVFDNLGDVNLPRHIRYRIRQNATLNPPTNQVRAPIWYPSPGSNNLDYYNFGFVWIQEAIERAIVSLQTGTAYFRHGALLHRMPYPCWNWDQFVWLIQHVVPLCLMLAWVYAVAILVQRLVHEKEVRLKEVMRMMGLGDGVHWSGWLITSGLQFSLTAAAITVMLHAGNVLPRSNPIIIFIYLETFAISSIAFSFLVASVFSRAKLAAACAGIFYFVTYVPYMYIAVTESVRKTQTSASIKCAASLLSTSALGLGGKYLFLYELEGSGLQWVTLGSSPREKDDFSMLHALVIMAGDTLLYFLLAWYIENIYPGAYGIPKPWYFPLTPSFWCGVTSDMTSWSPERLFGIRKKYRLQHNQSDTRTENDNYDSGVYWCGCSQECDCRMEAGPTGLKPAVVVNNLRKTYDGKDGRAAVDGLTFTLYEDQVTAFLGHNGAGKTTTMSILTGLFPPTSGTATVYGLDVRTSMRELRRDMGVCPQHNVLFDCMTVEEHILFYSRLKGVSLKDAKTEIKRLLSDLGMEAKRNCLPGALSGGMCRKLSIAIAFVGGARTVLLDEPTAGVDPYSRRAILKLLAQYKKGRTIFVSTHHLDEAEAIGDRILIMAEGRMRCGGSSTFLKRHYGDGHQLQVSFTSGQMNIQAKSVLEIIKSYVPRAHMKSISTQEVCFVVPVDTSERKCLVDVMHCLRERKDDLHIGTFGFSDCGLESVFIKVNADKLGKDSHNLQLDALGSSVNISENDFSVNEPPESFSDDVDLLDNHFNTDDNRRSFMDHMKALFIKRLWLMLRNRKALVSQVLLPALFVSISMTIALTAPRVADPDPIEMSTAQYFEATQPVGNFVPFSLNKDSRSNAKRSVDGKLKSENIPERLLETFYLPSGLGAACLLKTLNSSDLHKSPIITRNMFDESCSQYFEKETKLTFSSVQSFPDLVGNYRLSVNNDECKCKADNTGLSCEEKQEPSKWRLPMGDVIQDITSDTGNDDDFYLYGGYTFGGDLSYVPEILKNKSNTGNADNIVAMFAVWYNQKGYHSMPVYLNTFHNALLRASLPSHMGDPASYGITLLNHPMKQTTNDFLNSDYIKGGTDVLMAIFVIVAMSFVPASFVVTLVHERSVRAKHLQMSSGLRPVTYWLANFLWDMCNCLLPTVCIIGVLLVFRIDAYVEGDNLTAVILLFLVYGWTMTPMMYPASFLFTEPSVAYICLIVANLFIGITSVQISFMLKLFDFSQSVSAWNEFLGDVFLIFPNYCLGNGMMTVALNHYSNQYYSHLGYFDKMTSAMTWKIAGKRLVAMVVMGMVSFAVTLLIEYKLFCRTRVKSYPANRIIPDEDVDVEFERRRTMTSSADNDVVYHKRRGGSVKAVDNLTFSVPRGECFGLLGVNGAGKTSTFRMLTGDLRPTFGDVKLLGHSVTATGLDTQRHVGYCPQYDAIFDELTPRQHLSNPEVPDDAWCVAVRGPSGWSVERWDSPEDEPTSGLDPCSKRHLWSVIERQTSRGTAVVFSSHSMEECETLCDRLAIMAAGRLRCLGTLPRLKAQHGSGYSATVVVCSPNTLSAVRSHLEGSLRGASVGYQGSHALLVELPITCWELPEVLEALEKIPVTLGVVDYSINQNTLDKVFIKFATEQDKVKDTDDSLDCNSTLSDVTLNDDVTLEMTQRDTSGSDNALIEIL
ncbi:ABCA2-like protein [Mya arenaria]|uniref:ABCA2-like protein n=1 Tax=Mya arenaria TaxID=6604 RepID=A0ABY7GDL4_MYAAR|nr:ABCA2-like protein [Mya arenaria]